MFNMKEYQKKYYQKHKEKLNKQSTTWGKEHPEKHNQHTKNWRKQNKEHTKKYNRDYNQSEQGKRVGRDGAKRYRERHPNKVKCRAKIKGLIERKRIERDICAICGKENAETHHENYEEPYCFMWLCRKCHLGIHDKEMLK